MTVDLALLACIAVFAVLGLASGAAKQLGNAAGLVVSLLGTRPLVSLAGPPIAHALGTPVVPTLVALGTVLFVVLYSVAARLIRWLLAAILPEGESDALNRAGGLVLGAAKAAAVLYLLLCVALLVEGPLSRVLPALPALADRSVFIRLARRHNALAAWRAEGPPASPGPFRGVELR